MWKGNLAQHDHFLSAPERLLWSTHTLSVSAWHAEQVPDCSGGRVFQILLFPSSDFYCLGLQGSRAGWRVGAWKVYGCEMTCPSDTLSTKRGQLIDICEWIQENILFYPHLVAYSAADKRMGFFSPSRCLLWSFIHVGCLDWSYSVKCFFFRIYG